MRLIDADELQKLFNECTSRLLSNPNLQKDVEHMVRAFLMTTEMIQDAPTVDAVPVVHGVWRADDTGIKHYCSVCQKYNGSTTYMPHYCPNCGAKMEVHNG